MKPTLQLTVNLNSVDEIKELLPKVTALEETYDVNLTINYSSGMDLTDFPVLPENMHSS